MNNDIKQQLIRLVDLIPENGVITLSDLHSIEDLNNTVSLYSLLKKYGKDIFLWDRKTSSFTLKSEYIPLNSSAKKILIDALFLYVGEADLVGDSVSASTKASIFDQETDRKLKQIDEDIKGRKIGFVVGLIIFSIGVPLVFFLLKWADTYSLLN